MDTETATENHMLLNGDKWLDAIETEAEGDEISAPLGTTPFRKGTMSVLGAHTKVGKTAWGLQCGKHVADFGHSVAYCTLEMTPKLLFERFAPQFGDVELAKTWIAENNFHVSRAYIDLGEIEEILYRDFDFVVIDHLHELPFDDHRELAKKVKRIAALAPETNTAILALAQLKQPSDFDTGPPGIYSYSDTKVISEVSGLCQAIWRPDEDYPRDVELVTSANRFGAMADAVPLRLNKEKVIFERKGRF